MASGVDAWRCASRYLLVLFDWGMTRDRWETLDHRLKQDSRMGKNPETLPEDAAERAGQAVEEVPQQRGQVYERVQGETPRSSQSARIVDAEGRDCSREEETCRRGDHGAEFPFVDPGSRGREPQRRYLRSRPQLRVRRRARAILTRESWKERRCQAA